MCLLESFGCTSRALPLPYMEIQPDIGRLTITVPRKDKQPSRQAELTVRYAQVTLNPPKRSTPEVLTPITLWSV